jgi:vesicle coat complex subunit
VWIIGEHADRIQNCVSLFRQFIDSFLEEADQVQL